ncbi:hypothetical protein, partial [Pseudomonas sp. PS01296]|uniref:hypothetical protein n=1 Tax=Pseudomonas sp. PS01296 TaxID=2991432 RepID=UPI00249B062D
RRRFWAFRQSLTKLNVAGRHRPATRHRPAFQDEECAEIIIEISLMKSKDYVKIMLAPKRRWHFYTTNSLPKTPSYPSV